MYVHIKLLLGAGGTVAFLLQEYFIFVPTNSLATQTDGEMNDFGGRAYMERKPPGLLLRYP